MKQAHWNVRGPNFIAIHTLFDKVAGEAAGYADLLAERRAASAERRKARCRSPRSLRSCWLSVGRRRGRACLRRFRRLGGVRQIDARSDRAGGDFGDAETSDLFTEISRGRRSAALAGRIPCRAAMTAPSANARQIAAWVNEGGAGGEGKDEAAPYPGGRRRRHGRAAGRNARNARS